MSEVDPRASTGSPHFQPFGYLLATLMGLIAVHPFFVGSLWEPFFFDAILSLVFVASVFAVSRSTTTRAVVFIIALPIVASRWLIRAFPNETVTLFGLIAASAFIAFVAIKILAYVVRQTTISSDTIFAALCVYLLLGLGWGLLYALIEYLAPGSFTFPDTALHADRLRELIYFSLVTLATVGYGDITPVNPIAQGFSNLEAVLGQLYLAVMVARLVGIQVAQRMRTDSLD